MLFEGDINKFASGSGSVPSPGSTYDDITRKTALNAISALSEVASEAANIPFAFISAAEAKWTFDEAFTGTPLEWLRRYLIAKRAVEDALLNQYSADGKIRPIIVRPSLVWTWSKPGYDPICSSHSHCPRLAPIIG
jgi:nucleoside-diphosphate-sugar epimerase